MKPRQIPRRQRGIVLVAGLLFLVILTLLGLSLFRSTGIMDRIAANTRDKQRSFEAAQSALQYGEWWLGNNATPGGVNPAPCNSLDTDISKLHVCSNAMSASFATDALPFPSGFQFTPSGMTVAAGGGVAASAPADVNYKAAPGLYIEGKGLSLNGQSLIYQVSSYGFGGMADTGTVLRSTYQVTPTDKPLDKQ